MLRLGPKKVFVITKAQTRDLGHGTMNQSSEVTVILLTYSGAHVKSFYFTNTNVSIMRN